MKGILLLLLFLCPVVSMARQQQVMKAGDKVPDVLLESLRNHPKTSARLYDFKSRLILLDFWATTCGSCIGELKMLDSLKACYPGQFSVVAVNSLHDTKERLDKLVSRLKLKLSIPMVLGNRELQTMFPHYSVPHFAWLDSNFTVVAITGAGAVTASNIGTYISTGNIAFDDDDIVRPFNANLLLFENGNAGDGKQLFARSSMTAHLPGVPSGNFPVFDSLGRITRLLLINQTVEELLTRANRYFPEEARLKWEGIALAGDFTYELITPPISEAEAYRLLREDIARYLHISAEVSTGPSPVLFIRHLPN